MADPDNPLTARVMVNRVWLQHFGKALVRSPSNFGVIGQKPTHPGLLDWLAATFVEKGWSLKQLHRVAPRLQRLLVPALLALGLEPAQLGADVPQTPPIGIHGTDNPLNVGATIDRGTICLGDRDAEDVFDILSIGSRVVIRR